MLHGVEGSPPESPITSGALEAIVGLLDHAEADTRAASLKVSGHD